MREADPDWVRPARVRPAQGYFTVELKDDALGISYTGLFYSRTQGRCAWVRNVHPAEAGTEGNHYSPFPWSSMAASRAYAWAARAISATAT